MDRLRMLDALKNRVRVVSSQLLAQRDRRLLLRLERFGEIVSSVVFAKPLLPLTAPLVAWSPGMQAPDFGAVAYQLQKRWQGIQLRRTTVFHSRTTRIRSDQVTHDLHVASLWLSYGGIFEWVGEDSLGVDSREKRPDALLVDSAGSPRRAVEFGGCYKAERLVAIHEHLAITAGGLPYEVW